MKKKNWLLTIAFAVLALTIVSTTVLGGTYAKFVSTVSGGAQAQAAGFLVTGSASRTDATVLLAPGVTIDVEAGLTSYFSQVQTEITVVNSVSTGEGIFDSTNWATLVAYYNDYVASDADHRVDANLAIADVFQVNGGTTSASVAAAIYAAGYSETEADNVWASTYTTGSNILPAMKADATAALTLSNINLSISWVTPKCLTNTEVDNDEFDTYLGNCIAMLATTSSNSTVDVMTKTVSETPHTLTLTVGDGTGSATYHTSTISTTIGITAQQYIAPVTPAQGE